MQPKRVAMSSRRCQTRRQPVMACDDPSNTSMKSQSDHLPIHKSISISGPLSSGSRTSHTRTFSVPHIAEGTPSTHFQRCHPLPYPPHDPKPQHHTSRSTPSPSTPLTYTHSPPKTIYIIPSNPATHRQPTSSPPPSLPSSS